MKPYVFVSATKRTGSKDLRDKVKIEAKRVDLGEHMTRVHVGIVGYPNSGKSSIINLITRRGVTGTSKQAGHTKGMQKVRMSDKILILDTPGVIPEEEYSTDKRSKLFQDAKVGARTYSDVKDPEDVVDFLMKTHAKRIEKYYKIEAKGDSEFLIEEFGKQKNFLKKGGVVDLDRASRLILKDWQEGKIKA